MGKRSNNLVFKYTFIFCLGVTLLFSQIFTLHMHVQHDDISLASATKHSVNVHLTSSLHETMIDSNNHHTAVEFDVSPDSMVKKIELYNLAALLFFIIGFILCIPLVICIRKQYHYQSQLNPLLYLLQPPLRAPPSNFSI